MNFTKYPMRIDSSTYTMASSILYHNLHIDRSCVTVHNHDVADKMMDVKSVSHTPDRTRSTDNTNTDQPAPR